MSLFVVSSDWRFKERFKQHFSHAFMHEFTMVPKLVASVVQADEEEDIWVLADERLGTSSPLYLLQELEQAGRKIQVILFLDRGNPPFSLPELSFPVEFIHKESLNYTQFFLRFSEGQSVREESFYSTESLIGNSKTMQEVRSQLALYGKGECSVHLYGETGTGKEIAAGILHKIKNPFRNMVSVNCSLLHGPIGDSMFYGHTKGAFTDGKSDLPGLVHDANQSTLFLDEVENLTLDSQANMLRLLENGCYRQLGDTKEKVSKFRLVTASNQNLKHLIEDRRIRKDFYYRISDTTICLPPLRDHLEDVPLLCQHFIKGNFPGKRISEQDMMLLKLYSWPGNVRQLFSTLKRSCIRSGQEPLLHILPEDIS
ncbi:MAG: sigma-54-dependent Fis family transcriptional regulator [Spirochaetia bacterium]|nr:sigma-54-dependent Fis family transcriptional regulator [Spirochaetia bacterium]